MFFDYKLTDFKLKWFYISKIGTRNRNNGMLYF
jgi:hypothetical protein